MPHPTDAFEIIGEDGPAALVLSCEHATNQLPAGWSWPEADRWIVETHWAWDIGAADITRALSERLGAPAVFARFSRLLIDPNREPTSPTLIRDVADGRLVHLNRDLSGDERPRRLAYHQAYHQAFDDLVARRPGAPLLAIHTFTPVYEDGPPRPMEVGVLFDQEEALALQLAEAIAEGGLKVALNEPYSGKHGLMFAVQSHADRYDRPALELEVRQDLAGDPIQRARVVDVFARAIPQVLG